MKLSVFELNDLVAQYSRDDAFIVELKEFILELLDKKVFRFTVEDASNRFPLIYAQDIIGQDGRIVSGREIGIKTKPIFFYSLYKVFNEKYDYDFKGGMNELIAFHAQCENYFKVAGKMPINAGILNGYSAFLLISAFKTDNNDFIESLLGLRASDQGFFPFYTVFLENFAIWNFSFDKLWGLIVHYAEEIGIPPANVFDARWRLIREVLCEFLNVENVNFESIFHKAADNVGVGAKGNVANILLVQLKLKGLLSNSIFINWLTLPDKAHIALQGLMAGPIEDRSEIELIIDKLQKTVFSPQMRIEAYKLCVHILQSSSILSHLQEEKLKNLLTEGAESSDSEQVRGALIALCDYSKDTGFLQGQLDKILRTGKYHQSYVDILDIYFSQQKNTEFFFHFITGFAKLVGTTFKSQLFINAIESLYYYQKVDFMAGVIEMVTHDIGQVRYAGNEMLFHIIGLNNQSPFELDVSKMDALVQYKFVVSVSHWQMLLVEHLTSIVPFLLSKSEIVQELVICKLEELLTGYRIELIEKLEPMLSDFANKEQLLERLRSFLAALIEEIRRKLEIREFDSRYSHSRYIREFVQSYTKQTRNSVDKAQKEHKGISSLFRKGHIARAGGVILPNGTIEPLKRFAFEMGLSRTTYIDTEMEDYERFKFFNTNWEEDFNSCKQIILSSASI